jgi:hypothetical protein
MKRRTKRDLTIFVAILAVIGAVVFFNGQIGRQGLAEDFENLRESLEQARVNSGVPVLSWKVIRTTTGTLRKGANFTPELVAYNGKEVFLIGFMVPEEQFRDVTEFLMLPIPLECYFCSMPPTRDVLYVTLAEGQKADIAIEPVLVRGTLKLNEGPGVKFFYTLENAILESALEGGELTKKRLELQHMAPNHERDDSMLLPGVADDERSQSD